MTKLEQAFAWLCESGYRAEIDGSDIYIDVKGDYMEKISKSEISIYARQYVDDKMADKNVIIAEFMGNKYLEEYEYDFDHHYEQFWDIYITGHLNMDSNHNKAKHFYRPNEMKYHYSWDWLMPAVEKCLTTNETAANQHAIINDALLTCNINVIHEAVTDFIVKNKHCV